MANWKKIMWGTGIGAVIVGMVSYFTGLKRTGVELETVSTVKIHSLKLDGLTLRVDTQLKNPTDNSFSIKYPFVKILYSGKTVGTSQVINKDIKVPAFGEVKIEGVMIKIPFTGLLSLGSGIVNLITKKEAAKISVKTISTIDLGWKKIPYESVEDHTLHPKA